MRVRKRPGHVERLRWGLLEMSLRNLIVLALVAVAGGIPTPSVRADDSLDVPEAFAPFEYLIGKWNGNGVPTANRVRGWPETHSWAWRFEKGVPIGMSVTMKGDKLFTEARLAYDPASRIYRLEGTDPDKKPVAFSGMLDKAGKKLTLDRKGPASDGAKQQITLYPNSNQIRYTVTVLEKEPGAPQYKKTIEVGVGKEGEAFAAGSAVTDLPKCIVTGGAATLTVSYQGKSFPLCCSGCKAEFDENPEKYVKKAALRAAAAATTPSKPTSTVGKDDGSFDDEPKTKRPASTVAEPKKSTSATKPATKKEASKKPVDPEARAASLLKLGQSLEKAGKTTAALGYYRQILKDYPKSPAAKTADERVKELEPK
jgi:YHS domain-containing protein